MSPLFRSELNVVLCPERVALLRSEHDLTLRGVERRLRARKIIPCDMEGGGEKPWMRAMDALGTALPSVVGRKMDAHIMLSDCFMQYALVPRFDKLSEAEEVAVARLRFKEMCGDAADSMSIRISPGVRGMASLATGVDSGFLEELGKLMGRMRITVKSIQPHLMLAYNSCRASLVGRSAWLALLEPNSICLAVLRKGHPVWVRKLRIGGDWKTELPVILSREAYLADADLALNEVLLWAPHLDDIDVPAGWPWNIRQLTPDALSKRGAMLAAGAKWGRDDALSGLPDQH